MKKKALFLLLIFGCLKIFGQSTATANVSTFTINAPELQTDKKIWVYLPDSYSETQNPYPVLYLQDAQNLFDSETSFAGEWRIDETLDSLNLDLIVIGIEHGNEKRIDELTPFPHPEHKGGKADDYLKFIIETLMPEIEDKYNIKSGRQNTFIGGSSLGGLFSYYATLKHPEIFGKALVLSPSFWYTKDIFQFTERMETETLRDRKFYFRAGEKESETMVPLMFKIKDLLLYKGLPPEHLNISSIKEGEHNEALWANLFPQAALWLLEE